MTVMDYDDPAVPEPLTDSEVAEAMAYEALIFDLSVVLMRLDGNEGDPHQLIWCGGTVPEPWGDVWQKYEPQALSVLDAIGEGSARALVDALSPTHGIHNRFGGRDGGEIEYDSWCPCGVPAHCACPPSECHGEGIQRCRWCAMEANGWTRPDAAGVQSTSRRN